MAEFNFQVNYQTRGQPYFPPLRPWEKETYSTIKKANKAAQDVFRRILDKSWSYSECLEH